jgi:diguanylate cyclase (GGDEF)-like protein
MPATDEGPHVERDRELRPQLAAAFLVVSLLVALGGLTPADPDTAVGRWVAVASLYAVLAVLALALPAAPRTTQAILVTGVLAAGVVTGSCHSAQGVFTGCLGIILAGQLAAYALDLRRALAVGAVCVTTIAVAASVAPAPVRPSSTVVVVVLGLMTSALLGRQTHCLRVDAGTDHLTGALSRGAFYERLSGAVDRAQRTGRPLAVVALDIDDFKVVNATHGHLGADDLMTSLVGAWRADLDRHAFVGRVGGDEFVAVLPGHDAELARGWAALASSWTALPSSAGVAELRADDTMRTLLARADADLFAAKQRKADAEPTRAVVTDPVA